MIVSVVRLTVTHGGGFSLLGRLGGIERLTSQNIAKVIALLLHWTRRAGQEGFEEVTTALTRQGLYSREGADTETVSGPT